jgi:hypothetical protein
MPYVPKPLTSGAKAEGRFGKQDFVYLPGRNAYRCPAGELLTWHFDNIEDGRVLRHYWTTACQTCPTKPRCTTNKERRIRHWEHEDVLDAMQKRLDQVPQAMALRRRTVEFRGTRRLKVEGCGQMSLPAPQSSGRRPQPGTATPSGQALQAYSYRRTHG